MSYLTKTILNSSLFTANRKCRKISKATQSITGNIYVVFFSTSETCTMKGLTLTT